MLDYTLDDFREGDRVQFHPATDAWMRGQRYATVLAIGRSRVHVLPDIGAAKHVAPIDLTLVRAANEF